MLCSIHTSSICVQFEYDYMCLCVSVCLRVYTHVCMCMYACVNVCMCACMYGCMCNCIPYLSVLKPGSNICQVVQQNERNKRLGPFKRRVPKLINVTWCQTLRKISLFSISLLIFASLFRMLLQSIVYSIFIMFVVFPHWDALRSFTTPISE